MRTAAGEPSTVVVKMANLETLFCTELFVGLAISDQRSERVISSPGRSWYIKSSASSNSFLWVTGPRASKVRVSCVWPLIVVLILREDLMDDDCREELEGLRWR